MKGRLFTSGNFRNLEEAAARELAALRSDDPFREVIFLAGSNLLCAHLRRRLAANLGGLFNVRFVTFPDLVSLVEERVGSNRPSDVTSLSSRVLLGEILEGEIPECFLEAAVTDGFAEALHSTFTDLAEGGCGADEVVSILGSGDPRLCSDRVRGVLELYSRLRHRIAAIGGDVNTRFAEATENVSGALSGAAIFAYGFYDLNELQYRLLMAASQACRTAIFVPWKEDVSFRFAAPLVASLEGEGFKCERLEEDPQQIPETHLFNAPDAIEEAREVVRRIIELRESSGPRLGEIAILPWSKGDWPPLREALEEAGLEWYSRIDSYAAATSEKLGALRLLEYLCGEGGRSELVDLLISSPVQTGCDKGTAADPISLWVRTSAAEGMRGEIGWDVENNRLLEKVRRQEGKEVAGSESDLLEMAAGLISLIERARGEFVRCRDWSSFSSVFAGAVVSLFGSGEESGSVADVVNGLADLDRISQSCNMARFRRIARKLLESSPEGRGSLGSSGVNVITTGRARGLGFAVTFMTGLKEGSAPGRIKQDPFIKDGEREAILSVTGGRVRLASRAGRIEESALIFRLACSSASGMLICSWPRLETGGGGEYIPSSYLRRVHGISSDAGGWLGGARRIPLRGRPEGTEVPLGENDYDYLMTGRRVGRAVHYPESSFFARGAGMIEARWGRRRFTPFDGVFESARALGAVESAMASAGWNLSATTLQSYANCPFAFLVEKLIGVESVEEPERKITLDPLQHGTLMHFVLERLYRALSAARTIPLTETTLPAALKTADRVIAETLDLYADSEPVGHPLFWEFESRTVDGAVRDLLAEEAREGSDFVPEMFEEWFGAAGTPVTFDTGSRTLSFRGKIDRIDRCSGGAFRVIDYKTGSVSVKDQDLAGGSSLQLPVYLLAASKILGAPVESGIAMLRRIGTGGGRRKAVFSGASWKGDSVELGRVLEVIVEGISSGLFFASPDDRDCGYCRARQACPTSSAYLFESKASRDSRAKGYLEMRRIDL